MKLLPESVRTRSTSAIDETWAIRLQLLRFNLLKIDLYNEADRSKLDLWLEMFGISTAEIPTDLTTQEYQMLLRYIIRIYRLSGTPKSIELIAKILGATDVLVKRNYIIQYNSNYNFDGSCNFDGGEVDRPFVVDIAVAGIDLQKLPEFEQKFRKLFEVFEPAWIWLRGISYMGSTFGEGFPFILSEG